MNEKAEIDNKKRPLRPVLPSQNCKGDTQKVFVKTFGCQMNKYDSEILKGLLKNNRFDITDEIESADIALFNTCSVREHAENRVYGQVGSLKKLKSNGSPLKIIGIIGCMAQAHKEEIFKRLPHVDLVCGPQNLYNVVDYLQDIIDNNKKIIAVDGKQRPADVDNCKLRNKIKGYEAFVTIMEGCDNFCSFCIVPFVRGRERSRPPALIIKEIEELLKKGIKEITLLGQNVNSYGKGLKHNYSFVDLLEKIDKIGNLQRLRFITSHPKDAESKLFKTMARLPSACESLHLAVQSGSNKILKSMNRNYTREEYLKKVDNLRKYIPDCSISTDIIVGYPGETEEDFKQTVDLLEKVSFDTAYIFKYSPRPYTKAAELEDDVPDEVKRQRNQYLLSLQKEITKSNNKKFIGKNCGVLVQEQRQKEGKKYLVGKTREDKTVFFDGPEELMGRIVEVKIIDSNLSFLTGEWPRP